MVAILLECIENGTKDYSPEEIRATLSKHKPVMYGEKPTNCSEWDDLYVDL